MIKRLLIGLLMGAATVFCVWAIMFGMFAAMDWLYAQFGRLWGLIVSGAFLSVMLALLYASLSVKIVRGDK